MTSFNLLFLPRLSYLMMAKTNLRVTKSTGGKDTVSRGNRTNRKKTGKNYGITIVESHNLKYKYI